MADTRRSLSTLQTLLADNTSGAISPQDLRDALVSLVAPYGSIYQTAASPTTVSVQGTFYKAAGTTALKNARNFDMPTNNRLRYTGTTDVVVMVAATVTLESAGTNDEVAVRIGVDGDTTGTDAVASQVEQKLGGPSDKATVTTVFTATLSENSYLEVFVANQSGTDNLTVDDLQIVVTGLLV